MIRELTAALSIPDEDARKSYSVAGRAFGPFAVPRRALQYVLCQTKVSCLDIFLGTDIHHIYHQPMYTDWFGSRDSPHPRETDRLDANHTYRGYFHHCQLLYNF